MEINYAFSSRRLPFFPLSGTRGWYWCWQNQNVWSITAQRWRRAPMGERLKTHAETKGGCWFRTFCVTHIDTTKWLEKKNRSNWKVAAIKICQFSRESSPWVLAVWHGRPAKRRRSLKSDPGVSQRNASNQPRGITSSLGSGRAGSRGQAHGKSDRLSSPRSIPRLLLKCDMLRGRQGILLPNSPRGQFFFFFFFY